MNKIYDALALEKGFVRKNVTPIRKHAETWLKNQGLIAHHDPFDWTRAIFVDGKLHGWSGKYDGIRHMGSAQAMRKSQ